MKTVARTILSIVIILGFVWMICLSIGCGINEKYKTHYFFLGIAEWIRIILMLSMPIWLLAFIFGLPN